jgi:hypothetical protein
MLTAVTVGAVALGATLGLAPFAAADPVPAEPLVVDIVGDSYTAGDGIADTYMDPADPRHRSLVSPALQALSRVASENPGLRVDANVVASSGAVTADYFDAQRAAAGQGTGMVVNTAQHQQIRPSARVVIVGFGGSDAELAEVLAIAKPSNTSTPGDLDAKVKDFSGLLDTGATDQTYLDQAATSPPGGAPTLVSRMLQVLGAVSERAPGARIIVTNYPLPVDPEDPLSVALIKKRDLITVQKFLLDLDATIERAVRICQCADLADLTNALDGHEAYTDESAFAEPAPGRPHTKAVRPNDKGAALMAGPLAEDLAAVLGIRRPKPNDGTVTVPDNIAARSGVPDTDGDLVPDSRDEAPEDRTDHRKKQDRDRHHPDRTQTHGKDRQRDPRPTPHARLPHPAERKDPRPLDIIPVQLLPPTSPAPKRKPVHGSLPDAGRGTAPSQQPDDHTRWPIEDPDDHDRAETVRDRESLPGPEFSRLPGTAREETAGLSFEDITGAVEREAATGREENRRSYSADGFGRLIEQDEPDTAESQRPFSSEGFGRLAEQDEPGAAREEIPGSYPADGLDRLTEQDEAGAARQELPGAYSSDGFGRSVEQDEPGAAREEAAGSFSGSGFERLVGRAESAGSEPSAEGSVRVAEPDAAEAVPGQPVRAAEPVEAEQSAGEAVPRRTGWTAEPVEPVAEAPVVEVPVAEEPVAEEPVAVVPEAGRTVDEATGEPVCILIYPAPAGCGGTSEAEGSSVDGLSSSGGF